MSRGATVMIMNMITKVAGNIWRFLNDEGNSGGEGTRKGGMNRGGISDGVGCVSRGTAVRENACSYLDVEKRSDKKLKADCIGVFSVALES